MKENVKASGGGGSRRPPLGQNPPAAKDNGGWDNWNTEESTTKPTDFRRNQSVGDFRGGSRGGGGGGGGRGGGGGGCGGGRGPPSRSRSTTDMYTRSQLEESAANKDSFFDRIMAENQGRPEGLPPSQGGKYVGFGSSPGPSPSHHRSSSQGDMFSVVSQVIF